MGDPSELPVVDRAHYAIGREISHGGAARFVLARDLRLDREVVIKELLVSSDERRARLHREIRVVAGLAHPGIVAIHEAGRWPSGEPFYAMARAAGEPLERVIARTPTLAARLALVPHVIAAADAIAHAHARGVIHRQLANNVWIGEPGETVVIGWGEARGRDDEVAAVAERDRTVVSIDVPATVSGAGDAKDDARADVRALAALLGSLVGKARHPLGAVAARDHADARAFADAIRRASGSRGRARVATGLAALAIAGLAVAAATLAQAHRDDATPVPRAAPDVLARARDALTTDPTRAIAELARAPELRGDRAAELIAVEARARGVARHVLTGHTSLPLLVRLSPDGKRAASIDDKTIRLWDIEQGREIAYYTRSDLTGKSADLAFSPDGKVVAIFGARDSKVQLWTWADGDDRTWLAGVHHGTPALAFGGDGAPYSLGGDGALVRWTGETETRLADGATAFAMSADRTMFAFATGDGTVHLRVVGEPNGDLAQWQHLGAIVAVGVLDDTSVIAIDGHGHVTNLGRDRQALASEIDAPAVAQDLAISRTGAIAQLTQDRLRWWSDGRVHEIAGQFYRVAFSPDGAWLVAAGERALAIELASGAVHARLGHGVATSAGVSADGRLLATTGIDGSVRIWDMPARAFAVEPDVAEIALSPDGAVLATRTGGSASAIDTATGEVREVARRPGLTCLATSRDAIAVCDEQSVAVVSRGSTAGERRFSVAHAGAIAFSHDATQLAIGSDGLDVVELATGELRILDVLSPGSRLRDGVGSASWSADDRYVATATPASMTVWLAATAEDHALGRPGDHVLAAWRPTGARIAFADIEEQSLRVWDPDDDELVWSVSLDGTPATNLAFSPDGKRLALAFRDRTIRLWDAGTGAVTATLYSHEMPVRVAFDRDRLLVLDTHAIRLWDPAAGTSAWLGEAPGEALPHAAGEVVVRRGAEAMAIVRLDDGRASTTATITADDRLTSISVPSSAAPSSPAAAGSSHP